jgi:hypothetical protein
MPPRSPAERFGLSGRKPENFTPAFSIGQDSHYRSGRYAWEPDKAQRAALPAGF